MRWADFSTGSSLNCVNDSAAIGGGTSAGLKYMSSVYELVTYVPEVHAPKKSAAINKIVIFDFITCPPGLFKINIYFLCEFYITNTKKQNLYQYKQNGERINIS